MNVEYIDHMGTDLSIVNSARTKTQRRILEAVDRGYYITDDGVMFGPKGELNTGLRGSQRYATFSTNWDGYVFGVPIHQFAAYSYYGKDAFSRGTVVRHLDGDTTNNSKDNLRLGTHSENNLDKAPEVRSSAASKARAAQGTIPTNAKLTEEQVRYVRKKYAGITGKKAPNGWARELAEELGVSRTVLIKIKNGEYYESVPD